MNSRERSLRDLHSRSVEILLQTSIELGQATILEVGDTLLLVLDISSRAKFVSRHCRRSGAFERAGCVVVHAQWRKGVGRRGGVRVRITRGLRADDSARESAFCKTMIENVGDGSLKPESSESRSTDEETERGKKKGQRE